MSRGVQLLLKQPLHMASQACETDGLFPLRKQKPGKHQVQDKKSSEEVPHLILSIVFFLDRKIPLLSPFYYPFLVQLFLL